ncbi:hypothetical protein [Bdellovibrio bacteriovorus]|uniref:hypothetical protein n=1 Tax=Bdellovibrio bacteriovorus TaxID=959 RepID=UPI0035A6D4CE
MAALFTVLMSLFLHASFGGERDLTPGEVKLVEANVPKYFFSEKSIFSEKLITRDDISYEVKIAELEGKGKGEYLIVLYHARPSTTELYCELVAIKVSNKSVSEKTKFRFGDLGNCYVWELKDLDGDEIEEVIVTTATLRLKENPPDIFRWNGRGFVDVTPTDSEKNTMLGNFLVTDARVGNNLLMIAYSGDLSADRLDRLYVLKDGKFIQIGIYDWYLFRKKEAAAPKVFSDVFNLPAGDYTINVESRSSDPTKAVRVEFKVGDNVIVKASDMCSGPAPKGYKPPNDGDGNEDKNKGCIARKSTYTLVKLTGKETFKMTVYGATGSMVDVSLKKK